MSYFDRYKKRVTKYGVTQNDLFINQARENLTRNFSHIIGCTPVLVNEVRETEMVIESSNNDLEKKAIPKPNEEILIGDYLRFNQRLWLVKSVNTDVLSPVCSLLYCNQSMNAKWFTKPIPCHANNTTYGSKGVIDNGSKFLELDAKTKIYIQKNEETDKLYLGFRFILNNAYIYRITEMENTIFGGIYVITCQMDEGNVMDDYENNIAYNKREQHEDVSDEEVDVPEETPDTPPTLFSAELIGEEQVKRKTSTTYRLEQGFASHWTIDDDSMATLIPLPMNEVELITNNQKGWVTLTCEYNEHLIPVQDEEPIEVKTITKDIMIY